jgi:ribosomal protein S18 acetylase RimI-like enzyme
MHISTAAEGCARRQAAWIVALEPWRSLGYERRRLGAWLARCAREGRVCRARLGSTTLGIVVVRPEVLLGDFIALLAVRPEAAGRGVGRALVEHVAASTGRRRRWLFASSDSANRRAARFYRRLGFERVGRLPDLICPGRTEILWRLSVCTTGPASR